MSRLARARVAVLAPTVLLCLCVGTLDAGDPSGDASAVARDLLTLRRGIAVHALGTGALPGTLDALLERTEQADAALSSLPRDPWGGPYLYERLGTRSYRLVALGPDGKRDTPDDVRWPPPGQEPEISQAALVRLVIDALGSDDDRLVEQCRRRLMALPAYLPHLDETLLGEAVDVDRPWAARKACAGILLERRKTDLLEKTLREGDLDARSVVLTALRQAATFPALVANPDLGVEATVRAWLARPGDATRGDAIALALQVRLQDALPLIRPLLIRGEGEGEDDASTRLRLVQAGSAVALFGDCASLPALATLARSDPDAVVRLRSLQALHRVAFSPRAPCAGHVDDAAMRELVEQALGDGSQFVRMGALLLLGTNAAWAAGQRERLQAILRDEAGARAPERRAALEALAGAGGAAFQDELLRAFHDPDAGVRRAAVTLVASRRPPGLAGCLVGVLARERESAAAFQQALNGLRLYAGRLVGFPPEVQPDDARTRVQVQRALVAIFDGGTGLGLDRARLVDGWLRWLCADAGLTSDAAALLQARTAFWAAADRGDRDAARAALAGLPDAARRLLTHERGWLER